MNNIDKQFLESSNLLEHNSESHNIIDINSTYQILHEGEFVDPKPNEETETGSQSRTIIGNKAYVAGINAKLIAGDSKSGSNRMKRRPQGIVITDTYNHPLFPIREPRIDTAKFNLPRIFKVFQEYSGSKLHYLPWHFTIEFIQAQYYVFNTRPIDYKFPVTTTDANSILKKNDVKLNGRTEQFFEKRPFPIEEAIHIAVIGDSYKDIYLKTLYEAIGRTCAGPLLRHFKMPDKLWQKVWSLNMGKKFKTSLLEHTLKR